MQPIAEDYGVWVPGVPVLVESGLEAVGCAEWLSSLIIDGIVAGVGAVLGFVPQMLVLFIFLAFLEACGYMARIAFVMDRIFRKFGLSGKSFIPMLIGTGCGVPGIMASRTIENERDRRMTIMTTTFIPCGAKMPIIALIAGALFGNAWWVAPSAYFIGVAAIIISGIMLKKTKMFAGDPAPFVMELPAYHMPTVSNILRSMWERGWSFIKKAGTIILLSSVIIWAGSVFGTLPDGSFGFSADLELSDSVLGIIGNAICLIFAPLGFGEATAARLKRRLRRRRSRSPHPHRRRRQTRSSPARRAPRSRRRRMQAQPMWIRSSSSAIPPPRCSNPNRCSPAATAASRSGCRRAACCRLRRWPQPSTSPR